MHLIIILLFFMSCSLNAQVCQTLTGSAFERSTISGKPPKKILDETGTQVEVPLKSHTTRFIYIEADKKCNVRARRIWIDGKAFTLLQEEIVNKPIVLRNEYPGGITDTLIGKTDNQVFRLEPKQELKLRPGKKIRKQLSHSKMVIEYSYINGTGSCIIKEIKKLAPLVLP